MTGASGKQESTLVRLRYSFGKGQVFPHSRDRAIYLDRIATAGTSRTLHSPSLARRNGDHCGPKHASGLLIMENQSARCSRALKSMNRTKHGSEWRLITSLNRTWRRIVVCSNEMQCRQSLGSFPTSG